MFSVGVEHVVQGDFHFPYLSSFQMSAASNVHKSFILFEKVLNAQRCTSAVEVCGCYVQALSHANLQLSHHDSEIEGELIEKCLHCDALIGENTLH